MRKFFALILFFSGITFKVFSQEIVLDTHKNDLDAFIKNEQKMGGKLFKSETMYISNPGVGQPVIFKHEPTKLPPLMASYFAFEKTGKMDHIIYEWNDVAFNCTQVHNSRLKQEVLDFIAQYKLLYDKVNKQYSESEHTGNVDDTIGIATGKYDIEDTWKPNDSTEVELSLTLSNYYKVTANTTEYPGYRMRLFIRNIGKNAKPFFTEPSPQVLDSLYMVFTSFLSYMTGKKLEHARSYISDMVVRSVTNEQLDALAQQLRANEKFETYMSGMQTGPDGTPYLMVQYKYISDTNSPPIEVVKVFFDKNNKILGIQPLKRIK